LAGLFRILSSAPGPTHIGRKPKRKGNGFNPRPIMVRGCPSLVSERRAVPVAAPDSRPDPTGQPSIRRPGVEVRRSRWRFVQGGAFAVRLGVPRGNTRSSMERTSFWRSRRSDRVDNGRVPGREIQGREECVHPGAGGPAFADEGRYSGRSLQLPVQRRLPRPAELSWPVQTRSVRPESACPSPIWSKPEPACPTRPCPTCLSNCLVQPACPHPNPSRHGNPPRETRRRRLRCPNGIRGRRG
jgi:hypothetical protein